MSLKRKRDNGDNEEFGGNMGQVLPVARLPPDFDPASAAGEMDGAVYLALVRRDAQARPHTTRVPNPFLATASAAPAILRVNGDGDDDAALPSDEWRATFERRFRAFRANLRHTPIHVGRPPARVAVPGWTDRDGWWAFINGLPPPSKTKAKAKPKTKPAQRRVVVLDADALMYEEVQQGWGGARDFVPTARPPAQDFVATARGQVEDFVPTVRAPAQDFAPAARAQEDFVPAARTQADDEWQQIEDGELPDGAGPLDGEKDDHEPEAGLQDWDDEPEPEAGELPRSPSPPIQRPREPSRALLECINHRTTLQLLKHFRHWLTLSPLLSPPLSHLHARWLFALLAHAAPPAELVADEMSVLRQTAKAVLARIRRLRECADEADSVEMAAREAVQRENGEADGRQNGGGEEETAWWLVFAAVAAGFAQRDLWDEARAVLS